MIVESSQPGRGQRPVQAEPDPLSRFRRKIAENAAGWLEFVRQRPDDIATVEREFANLARAAAQPVFDSSIAPSQVNRRTELTAMSV